MLQIQLPNEASPIYIRPVPLISMQHNALRNEIGTFGSEYTVTFVGTLIDNRGSPTSIGNTPLTFETADEKEDIVDKDSAHTIFEKQAALRDIFSTDGIKFSITDAEDGATPDTVFYGKLQSLDFEEGIYINTCRYTAVFTVTNLEDDAGIFFESDTMGGSTEADQSDNTSFSNRQILSAAQQRAEYGGLVENFTDQWSFEVNEDQGVTSDSDPNKIESSRSYIITRNMTAQGRTYFETSGGQTKKFPAWKEAKEFLIKSIIGETGDSPENYPDRALTNFFAVGSLNISEDYGGYNHVRTESIDKTSGSVTITDTWLLSKGVAATESYSMSINSDTGSPFVSVNINGTIQGLSSLSAKSEAYGGNEVVENNGNPIATAFQNAQQKYYKVTNRGRYGINSFVYKRAQSVVEPTLNPQPLDISIAQNKFTGELTYSLTFDNRPRNIISEAVSESISVNDTYPGDLYALIPVIGRPTGPILQYIGGRTEYKRDITIELLFDYTDIDYRTNGTRSELLLSKPTINEPIRTQINKLVQELSPLTEPLIRKCFLNPPQESWSPREGRYSLSLSWVYELAPDTEGTAIANSDTSPLPGEDNNNSTGILSNLWPIPVEAFTGPQ